MQERESNLRRKPAKNMETDKKNILEYTVEEVFESIAEMYNETVAQKFKGTQYIHSKKLLFKQVKMSVLKSFSLFTSCLNYSPGSFSSRKFQSILIHYIQALALSYLKLTHIYLMF